MFFLKTDGCYAQNLDPRSFTGTAGKPSVACHLQPDGLFALTPQSYDSTTRKFS